MKYELVWVLMSWVAGGSQTITYGPQVADLPSCTRMQQAAIDVVGGLYHEGHKCVQIAIPKEEKNEKQSVPIPAQHRLK